MLIVVSHAEPRLNEGALINALFEAGLTVFHLRKPGASATELQQLLERIHPDHYSKIALHQHHALAKSFGLKRLHFPEAKRGETGVKGWQGLREEGYCLSTSVHHPDALVPPEFAYAFYGPLFDSISKKGYKAAEGIANPSNRPRLVAIGGIDETNCEAALQMAFGGVAVSGAVWLSDDPVNQFIKIQNKCRSIVPL